jgi:hypothetical protein
MSMTTPTTPIDWTAAGAALQDAEDALALYCAGAR